MVLQMRIKGDETKLEAAEQFFTENVGAQTHEQVLSVKKVARDFLLGLPVHWSSLDVKTSNEMRLRKLVVHLGVVA